MGCELVETLLGRVERYFADYEEEVVVVSEVVDRLVGIVVAMWVAQELRMTELRTALGGKGGGGDNGDGGSGSNNGDGGSSVWVPLIGDMGLREDEISGYRWEEEDAFGRARDVRDDVNGLGWGRFRLSASASASAASPSFTARYW